MNKLDQFKPFAKQSKTKIIINNNAVIYTRVSDIKQSDNTSLESQKKYCTEYAIRKELTVLNYFGGTYESAKTDDRKEFKKMLDFVKKNKITYIVVYSIDRFSRAGASAISIVETLRKKSIKVLAVTQPVDPETTSGSFFQNINLLFSKYDNDLRRDKTITGMKQRLLNGYYLGKAPLGYENKRDEQDKPIIVLNEDAEYIKKAFLWKANEVLSNSEIIKKLDNYGFKIYKQKLSQILKNPTYCGLVTNNLLEGEIVEGKHEGLISKELFLKVNGIQLNNNHGYKQNKINENLPLKGFIRCSTCDTKLTGYVVKNKGLYYYKCRKNGCCCNRNSNVIHTKFETLLSKYELNNTIKVLVKTQLKYIFDHIHKSSSKNITSLKYNLKTINDKIEKIEERFVTGEIESVLYHKFILKFKEEKTEIEKEIKKGTVKSSNLENYLKKAMDLLTNLKATWDLASYLEKQKLQTLLFPNGIIYNREKDIVRTNKVNSFLELINSLSVVFNSKEKGQTNENVNLSSLVAGTGLEPVTFGL